jgi:hypothetical protein
MPWLTPPSAAAMAPLRPRLKLSYPLSAPRIQVRSATPATYYAHRKRRPSPDERPARIKSDEALRVAIKRVWGDDFQVYGAKQVWQQLRREGVYVARCAGERLMRDMGLRGAVRGRAFNVTATADAAAQRPADLVNPVSGRASCTSRSLSELIHHSDSGKRCTPDPNAATPSDCLCRSAVLRSSATTPVM